MKNSDMPASACTGDAYMDITAEGNEQSTNGTGLTKREHFAGLAMQSLVPFSDTSPAEVAKLSIQYADALLKELDK